MSRRTFSPDVKIIVPRKSWSGLNLGEIIASRDIFWMLSWRNLSTRYSQMFFGLAWAGIEPLVTTLIMVTVFGIFMALPSEGVPYSLFVIVGLIPYTLFSKTLMAGSFSMAENMGIISKVYFPRIILPVSSAFREIIPSLAPFVLMVPLMIYHGLPLTWHIVVLPFAMLLAFVFGIGISYWLAALIIQFRDIGYFLNIFVQIMVYLSPVAYSASLVPAKLMYLYQLNPLYWAIGLARWSVLSVPLAITPQFYAAVAMTFGIFVTGLFVFARFEREAVDLY